jgi:hypothetical protein
MGRGGEGGGFEGGVMVLGACYLYAIFALSGVKTLRLQESGLSGNIWRHEEMKVILA